MQGRLNMFERYRLENGIKVEKDKNIWEKLYSESEIIYFPRDVINISSTEIRSNPYKYYDYGT